MADVTISYKGDDILELSDSGSATLKTGGKYCEDDIAVEYVKPSGGESGITLNCSSLVLGHFPNNEPLLELHLPYATTLEKLYQALGLSGIKIIGARPTSMNRAFYLGSIEYNLKTIDLSESDLSSVTSYYWCFENRSGLTHIYGELDFTNVNDVTEIFYRCNALSHVRFKQNSLHVGISFAQGNGGTALDADSLISVANGLSSTTVKTVTFTSNEKTLLNSIIGIIVDGTFTADENGTVTLMDFITNTKGWTVA